MHALVWLLSGLLAGWFARLLMKGPRLGFVADFTLGSLGSVLGTWLLTVLGGRVPAAASVSHLGVAAVGAMVLVAAFRIVGWTATGAGRYARDLGITHAAPDLGTLVEHLGDVEKRMVEAVLRKRTVSRDANRSYADQMTLGQRVADRVAEFGGSWPFLGLFAAFLLGWILLNSEQHRPFDPYPFILLNLILSCLAAVQAPVIMMSQNRHAAKDRVHAQQDYEVNVKAEMEVLALRAKLDETHEQQLQTLLDHHARLIAVLAGIDERLARLETAD